MCREEARLTSPPLPFKSGPRRSHGGAVHFAGPLKIGGASHEEHGASAVRLRAQAFGAVLGSTDRQGLVVQGLATSRAGQSFRAVKSAASDAANPFVSSFPWARPGIRHIRPPENGLFIHPLMGEGQLKRAERRFSIHMSFKVRHPAPEPETADFTSRYSAETCHAYCWPSDRNSRTLQLLHYGEVLQDVKPRTSIQVHLAHQALGEALLGLLTRSLNASVEPRSSPAL